MFLPHYALLSFSFCATFKLFFSFSIFNLVVLYLSQQQVQEHDFSYQNQLTVLWYSQCNCLMFLFFIFNMNFLPSFRPKNPLLKVTQSLIDSNTKSILPSTHPCLLSSFTLVHLASRTHDCIGARVLQTFTSCPGKLLTLFSVSTVSPPEVKGWVSGFPGLFLVYLLLGLQSDSKPNPATCLPI